MTQREPRRRRGAALVVALVCLVIVTAMIGNMLVGAMRAGRQMRVERECRQCDILLQAGIDHAVRQTSAVATYRGEVWDVSADEIGGSGAGQVTIEVGRPAEGPPQIRVLAEYPVGSELSIRRSQSLQLP
jgi:hypothetical protein